MVDVVLAEPPPDRVSYVHFCENLWTAEAVNLHTVSTTYFLNFEWVNISDTTLAQNTLKSNLKSEMRFWVYINSIEII